MKTLRVTLADILGPVGPSHGQTSTEVWARYVDGAGPAVLTTTDGTVVTAAARRVALSADGVADIEVYASDDALIDPEMHGFGVQVGWGFRVRGVHGRDVDVKGSHTVQVLTASPEVEGRVLFGSLLDHVPVTPLPGGPGGGPSGYLDHGNQTGAVTYAATIGTHALTMTGDTTVTLTGGTNGSTISVWATGEFTLTVEGVEVSTGEAVATMVRDVWEVRVIGGASGEAPAPGLAIPTASVTSSTDSTITVTYATTTPGATAWQYSLNSGAPAALDGTSPDTITGLPGSSSGTIKVRYTVDGTTWSNYSTPAAYATDAPAFVPTVLRLTYPDTTNVAESGDGTAGYTYTWSARNAYVQGVRSADASKIAAGQDGYFEFTLTGASDFDVALGNAVGQVPQTVTNPLKATMRNTDRTIGVNGGGTFLNGGVYFSTLSWAAGSTFRIGRAGSTLYLRASTDGFATHNAIIETSESGAEFIDLHLTINTFGTVTFTAGSSVSGLKRAALGTALTLITTPTAPVLRRTNAGNVIQIPTTTNLEYRIAGSPVTGDVTVTGSTATVTRHPAAGYCVYRGIRASGWVFTLATDTLPLATAAPAMVSVTMSDSFNRADGAVGTSDSATGGAAKTYTVTGTATTTSNQLVMPSSASSSITVPSLTSGRYQIEFDIVSGAPLRLEMPNWALCVEWRADASVLVRANGAWETAAVATTPRGTTTGVVAGRYAIIATTSTVTVLGPSGFNAARWTFPMGTLPATTTLKFMNVSATTDTGGSPTAAATVVLDNLKVGVPA